MKRIFYGLMVAILLISILSSFVFALEVPYKRGDANGDGVITIADKLLIQQYLAGIVGDEDICYINAASVDLHDPTTIGTCDAMFIGQYLAGFRDENFVVIV